MSIDDEQKARNRKSSDRWKANNAEYYKAKQLEYYYANREKRLAYMKEYQKTHPPKPRVSTRKPREAPSAEVLEQRKENRKAYWHKWYAENRERRKLQRAAKKEEAHVHEDH